MVDKVTGPCSSYLFCFSNYFAMTHLLFIHAPPHPLFQKQVGKLFYHISLWKDISRDSDSLIGGQILEIHVSFPILFELWFDTFFSLFFWGS